MLNINALLNAETKAIEPYLKPINPVKLKKGSISSKIIIYLFKHGNCSSGKVIAALDLDNSPMGYIQPHIKMRRIIADKINLHQCNYMINPILALEDFGLNEENLKWKQNY